MPQACPWIESTIWDDEKILAERSHVDDWVTAHIRNEGLFQTINIVSSPQSGSGKTKSILEAIENIKSNDKSAQVARIIIH